MKCSVGNFCFSLKLLTVIPNLTELADKWEQWFASHWSETER